MISFTAAEIFRSCAIAGGYGIFFAAIWYLFIALIRELGYIIAVPKYAIAYTGKLFKLPVHNEEGQNGGRLRGEIRVATGIILFTLGYILCSYYSLDGSLRLYTAALSVGTFFISRPYLKSGIELLVKKAIFSLFFIPLLFLRILLYPIYRIWIKYRKNA